MAKKDMTHPDVTRGPRNETSPVPQIQGKAKSGKEKANPIIAGTTGANQKVWHEKPISNPVIYVGGSFTVLHVACIGEAIQLLRDKLNQKNVYYMNPAIDM